MWFIIVLILAGLTTVYSSDNVEVTTPSGRILGSTLTSRLGKTIYSFRGIRYAQPPINELRFKSPVPSGGWPGVYDARADAPSCPQPVIRPISEDCLFLNVYTTELPKAGSNPKRPVIVYLHTGAYSFFTGRSNWVGPQYFMDQDIVLVSLNYRLATLGFLSVGKEVPGNNGLRDQVVALKWIKKHIAAFGGDPDNVTLFGYSAGALSVHLHMVSPMSRGLFHKAIMGSGSILSFAPRRKNQLDVAKKQARIVGCPDNSTEEIVECLRTKSAEELANSFFQFAEFGDSPLVIWSPVIEEDYGQERFLPDHPIKLIYEGQFQQVPVMSGLTRDEFKYGAASLIANETLLKALSDNWEKYAPIIFTYERDTPRSKEISRALRKAYLGEGPLSNASSQGLAQLGYDPIDFEVHRGVELVSVKSSELVYNFNFTYQGRYSYYYLPGTQRPYGVVHHDDLIYLFYTSELFPFFNQSYSEQKMVEKLTTLYSNFAKTGNPTPVVTADLDNVEWKPYKKDCPKYLDIGNTLVLKERGKNQLPLWHQLYPLSLYL